MINAVLIVSLILFVTYGVSIEVHREDLVNVLEGGQYPLVKEEIEKIETFCSKNDYKVSYNLVKMWKLKKKVYRLRDDIYKEEEV